MASAVYPKFKQKCLDSSGPDLSSVNVKAVLIDTVDYTYSAAHDFLDDVAVAGRVATSGNLASKTITDGVFDAADVTLSAVSGDSVEAIIIYHDSGAEATSTLVAYIDSGTGLPFTPSGGDVQIQWDNGASKIFAL